MDLFHMERYWSDEDREDRVVVQNSSEKEVAAKLQAKLQAKKKKKPEGEGEQEAPTVVEGETAQEDEPKAEDGSKETKKKRNKKKRRAEKDADGSQDFTPLGESLVQKKAKVRRVLPEWLANPDIVSVDLKDEQVSVNDLPGLDAETSALLRRRGITHFFPVQRQVIPHLLDSPAHRVFRPSDVCVSAPTGSGKTLTYVLPVVQALRSRVVVRIRALVVLPVQDLAAQVLKVFQAYAEGTGLKVKLLTAAKPFAQEQYELVREGAACTHSLADVVVATPGRLVDHIRKTPGFSLSHLRYLIIDEADRVMGDVLQNDWLASVEDAVYTAGGKRTRPGVVTVTSLERREIPLQKLLFSATLSQNPEQLEQLHLFEPKLFTSVVKPKNIVREARDSANAAAEGEDEDAGKQEFVGQYTTPAELRELFVVCRDSLKKPQMLHHVMTTRKVKKALVFAKSVEHTASLAALLDGYGHAVGELSSNVTKGKRGRILNQLSSGELDAVVCSDALARGIDIGDVDYVISYDCPSFVKTYIHRVGRTARAGREGTAVTLVEEAEVKRFKAMMREAGKKDLVEEVEVPDEELDEELYERAAAAAATTHDKSPAKRRLKRGKQ